MKMLVQSCWLLSLLFTVLATASADAKKSSTTASSQPITSTIHLPTSSIKSESSILSSTHPTTSTAAPDPTSSAFYLVVKDTGTPFDGDYLYVGEAFSGDGLFVLLFGPQEPDPDLAQIFTLSNATYGSLTEDASGSVATYYDLYGGLLFETPDPSVPDPASCELSDFVILCQNTAYSSFYTYPSTVVDGASTVPYVELGPLPLPSGSVQLTLLPIPID